MGRGGGRGSVLSLHARLLLAASVMVSVALCGGGLILAAIFRDVSVRSFDEHLDVLANSLIKNVRLRSDGTLDVVAGIGDPRFDLPRSGWYWQIETGFGPFLRSVSLWDETLDFHPTGVRDTHAMPLTMGGERLYKGQRVRFVVRQLFFPGLGRPVWMMVTGETSRMEASIRRFNVILFISLVMFGVSLVAAIFVQIRYGLRPLSRLTRQLGEVREGRREDLGDGHFPREVSPLVRQINGLIRHNVRLVEQSRLHIGNLAHALRTPLSVLMNEVRMKPDAVSFETLQEQLDVMKGYVDHHLARARSSAMAGVPRGQVNIMSVLASLRHVLSQLYRDKTLHVESEALEGVRCVGDKHDIEEMIGNLMDNACKWASQRVWVHCQYMSGAKTACLMFDDDGDGLPLSVRERVFQRGLRLDEMTPGTGLGLSIVRDKVRLYGGHIALEDSPYGGLRVLLTLPVVVTS